MKESTDLRDLPRGWALTVLKELVHHHSGNSNLIKGKMHKTPGPGLYPAFSATGHDVWHDGYEHEGDVIIVSAVGARCGKCFLASGRWSAIANTHVIWPISEVADRRFLWYRINDENFWIRSGSAQPFVKVKDSLNLPFLVPPLDEQHRIAAKIEELFTKLDAGVEALRKVKAQLKRYRQAVLKHAFEGKLTQEWREAHKGELEPASVLLERIKEERKKTLGKKFKELPPVDTSTLPEPPEGWVWTRVREISEFIQYGTSEKARNDPSGIPVVRMGDIQDGKLVFQNLKYFPADWPAQDDFVLQDGDVLFNRTNSAELVGKTAVYRSAHPRSVFASYLIRVRVNTEAYNPDILALFINSYYGRRYITSVASQQVGQANVNGTKLSLMPISLPSLPEQSKMVEEIERCLSVADQVEKTAEQSLKQGDRFRQSILKRAFEGKLVPQDPTDEPVSVLLERIKAEKEKPAPEEKPARRRKRKSKPKQTRLI